ncbi:MAG: anthranilate synthase component II [Flavisolibacter sp.]
MKILVFDNYDSFTYNLVHLVKKIVSDPVDVFRNDRIPLEDVAGYDKIILSPGPGIPSEAGQLLPLIKEYAASKSILGVCLGHQAIGEAFGGSLLNLSTVYHGVALPVRIVKGASDVKRETSDVKRESSIVNRQSRKSEYDKKGKVPLTIDDSRLTTSPLFVGLPETFNVGRYHSWIINESDFPEELEITARDENGYIMGLQHKTFDIQGVQFHPESVLTPDGETIMRNWLKG